MSCSTGYAPNTTTKIGLNVSSASGGTVVCRAYDAGGNERAKLSNSVPGTYTVRNFTVPRAKYFMTCVRTSSSSGGGGKISDIGWLAG
ncbi:hypothetical protein ABT336_06945 [Micromonospora sp. NPDC000207]|uniref:hypothetical protein n=1 Tax=Micromonospora sp. NPDC000207 TaxID=3154246 RepID=UPI0033339575